MCKVLEEIKEDYKYYKEKVNQCAGYFVKDSFEKIEYTIDQKIIDKMHELKIVTTDFSKYVVELCDGNYSKLFFLLIFAYSVEV